MEGEGLHLDMGKDLERLIVNTFINASPEKRRWVEQKSEERTCSIDNILCGCCLLLFQAKV